MHHLSGLGITPKYHPDINLSTKLSCVIVQNSPFTTSTPSLSSNLQTSPALIVSYHATLSAFVEVLPTCPYVTRQCRAVAALSPMGRIGNAHHLPFATTTRLESITIRNLPLLSGLVGRELCYGIKHQFRNLSDGRMWRDYKGRAN